MKEDEQMDTEHVVDVSEDERRPRRLSERLREAREYLGLSQQYVSDKTGIPRPSVSAIENCKRRVEALELDALATLYRYPVTHFLGSSVEEPASIQALAREAGDLSDRDREEVIRFAQFLKAYGSTRSDAK